MAKVKYRDWKPGKTALALIRTAEQIAADYAAQGYDLTLRQLYYQFVARGIIPNRQAEYSRLGDVLNRARMAGLFDWDYIVDRTRNLKSIGHWDSPAQIMRGAARSFAQDMWRNQPNRVEVWVEKEALAGVVGQVADRHDVAYFACRGYVSASELWGAAQRLGQYVRDGQNVTVLHLGDHDPSGIDMTRDIEERLTLIVRQDNITKAAQWCHRHKPGFADWDEDAQIRLVQDRLAGYGTIEVNRIALNMDQVDQYDPPPNPAKLTDSRVGPYLEAYGESSWELDALDPSVLDDLIEGHILTLRSETRWLADHAEQETHRRLLQSASDNWGDVVEFLA